MVRRFTLSELPDVVPVFPLPGALLLPRAVLPLNIFEPRYLAMLDDALRSDHRLIGMIQPRSAEGERSGSPPLQSIGCVGRVTSLSETDDGRYLIALTGISRFRIKREIEGFTPYRRVEVDWTPFERDLDGDDIDEDFSRTAFLSLLSRYFDIANLTGDWDTLKDADEEMLINSLSMLCPFAVQEKQALLESPELEDRRKTLMALMEFAIAGASGDEGVA
jgi:Lon protease-like protein